MHIESKNYLFLRNGLLLRQCTQNVIEMLQNQHPLQFRLITHYSFIQRFCMLNHSAPSKTESLHGHHISKDMNTNRPKSLKLISEITNR